MSFLDEPAWRGKVYQGGWTRGAGVGASGTGARFGGGANADAFTDTRWVTIRGDIAPYPF